MTTEAKQLEREIDAALSSDPGAPRAPKPGQLLGHTASGKPVVVPKGVGAPDTNDILVFRKTKARFPGWTKGDHMEASHLLERAGEVATATGDGKLARRLSRWSSVHWDIGGRWTSPELDAHLSRLGISR